MSQNKIINIPSDLAVSVLATLIHANGNKLHVERSAYDATPQHYRIQCIATVDNETKEILSLDFQLFTPADDEKNPPSRPGVLEA